MAGFVQNLQRPHSGKGRVSTQGKRYLHDRWLQYEVLDEMMFLDIPIAILLVAICAYGLVEVRGLWR
jgi:hypothetical protein